MGLGSALLMLNRPKDALLQFQQSVQLKPDDPEAQNNLATTLANLGQLSEALDHYQEAVRLKPNYLEAWANLMAAYDKLNRPAEAVAAAQKLVALARSQGQTALAEKVQSWLSDHRDVQSK